MINAIPILDPAPSEGEWIDRFARELARLGAQVQLSDLAYLAREVWPYLGDLPPEWVARCDWDGNPSAETGSIPPVAFVCAGADWVQAQFGEPNAENRA